MACGVVLVKELSTGRCDASAFGCALTADPTEDNRFFVRRGCVGKFWCHRLAGAIAEDKDRVCGRLGSNETYECDCRAMLPLIVPLFQPHFAYGCNLFHSAAARTEVLTARHASSGSLNRLQFVPVFSTMEDRALFGRWYGEVSIAQAIVVPVGRGQNAPATKKLGALAALFHSAEPPSHAIALDAETVVNSYEGQRAWAYIRNWSTHRRIIVDSGRGPTHMGRLAKSCAALELPTLSGYPWFADAPIFSRDDFDDFHSRLTRARRSPLFDALFLEHAAYSCYKAHVQNWSVVEFKTGQRLGPLENYDERHQDAKVANYSFLWARGAARQRLLRFHLDRDLVRPSQLCSAATNETMRAHWARGEALLAADSYVDLHPPLNPSVNQTEPQILT